MSQSETVLLVVLGFAVASLVGLILGWIAWKAAIRLGAKRALRTLPSTVTELQSERDRLRSENAMLTARLEMRLADMKMRLGEQAAEVSRHRNRMQILLTTLSDAETILATRDSEIAKLNDEMQLLRQERDGLIEELNRAVAMAVAASEARPVDILPAPQGLEAGDFVSPIIPAEPQLTPTKTNQTLRRRIQDITRTSDKISQEREKKLTPAPLLAPEAVFVKPANSSEGRTDIMVPPHLNEQVVAAEEASHVLQQELAKLDALWAQTELSETEIKPAAAHDTSQRQSVTNVVSLANRLKALQQSIKN